MLLVKMQLVDNIPKKHLSFMALNKKICDRGRFTCVYVSMVLTFKSLDKINEQQKINLSS